MRDLAETLRVHRLSSAARPDRYASAWASVTTRSFKPPSSWMANIVYLTLVSAAIDGPGGFRHTGPPFLMPRGTARVGAKGTAIVSTISPVATIGLVVIVLGEPFGWLESVGRAFVLGGVGPFSLIESRLPLLPCRR